MGRAELAANVVRQDGAPAAQVWCRILGCASAVKVPYLSGLTGGVAATLFVTDCFCKM